MYVVMDGRRGRVGSYFVRIVQLIFVHKTVIVSYPSSDLQREFSIIIHTRIVNRILIEFVLLYSDGFRFLILLLILFYADVERSFSGVFCRLVRGSILRYRDNLPVVVDDVDIAPVAGLGDFAVLERDDGPYGGVLYIYFGVSAATVLRHSIRGNF